MSWRLSSSRTRSERARRVVTIPTVASRTGEGCGHERVRCISFQRKYAVVNTGCELTMSSGKAVIRKLGSPFAGALASESADLSAQSLTNGDAAELARLLRLGAGAACQSLDLFENAIGDEGCAALAAALTPSAAAAAGDPASTSADAAGAGAGAGAGGTAQHLLSLRLAGNRFGAAGCAALAKALEVWLLSLLTLAAIADGARA